MKKMFSISAAVIVCLAFAQAVSARKDKGFDVLEKQFRALPMEARRLTGPLFWLHGDANETRQRLELILEKVAAGGNGCFTAESRPHSDWLGPRWYKDLTICLEKARKLNLKMLIFDERWWPSQTLGGKVPPEYRAKRLVAEAKVVQGPARFQAGEYGGKNFVAAIAGRSAPEGIDGESLVDLSSFIRKGKLDWKAPKGKWQVIKFTWITAPKARQSRQFTVDGASRDCVDWFIKTVYQPHYDRFKSDHGKTIVGYFYDEPETQGDWGTELKSIFDERKVDWKKALVAYKLRLAGDDQVAGRYAYLDAFFEAWGRTMYGGMRKWCEDHRTISIGHFMEHNGLYLKHGLGAGNMFQMQKYSDMGGIDLVCRQMYPGQRPHGIYQTAKLASSISHAYNKTDHLAMCEIYGGYNQVLTYEEMKWLADQMQVRGVNFMITHSFNPKAPHDRDYPPYFYNGGFEPRWPLYRVYAEYTNRLSLLLTGGRHVCPVAMLFVGNSKHVGKTTTPEDMTSSLQDALFDCDWMPYDVFENDTRLVGKEIHLYEERYKILIVPPVEVIPPAALEKAKAFLNAGGVVVGYGVLPSASATLGRGSKDVAALREAIWGKPKTGLKVCRTTPAGGRSYFLPDKPTPEQLQQVLTADAKIHPTLEVLEGETNHWLHVLHRVKNDRDVLLVCNQDHKGAAKRFKLRIRAAGEPECWDAMRNEITAIAFKRVNANTVDVDLTLEPAESVLLVFRHHAVKRPARITPGALPVRKPIAIARTNSPASASKVAKTKTKTRAIASPITADPFVGRCELPANLDMKNSGVYIEMDKLPRSAASVKVNGVFAGGAIGRPWRLDVSRFLKPGTNEIRIEPLAPAAARLVVYRRASGAKKTGS